MWIAPRNPDDRLAARDCSRVSGSEIERFVAPQDCTADIELSRLIRKIRICLRRRPAMIVIDLSDLRVMNSLLLSTVVYLARECDRTGVRLRLDGVCPLFRDWAVTHGLMGHLRRAGFVMGDEAEDQPRRV